MNLPASRILYRNMKEVVGPEHTALVVWDVQNALVDSIYNKEEFLRNLRALIESARSRHLPVIYTRITPLPPEFESASRTYLRMKAAGVDDPGKLPPFMALGSPQAQIHSEVAPKPGDLVLDKHSQSVFIGTPFEYMMRNRGTSTVVFTGLSTDVGIDTSARDAAARGYYSVVVGDCVSTGGADNQEACLKGMKRVCLIASSREVMAAWES
jgi:nicotinamidase-related amidase